MKKFLAIALALSLCLTMSLAAAETVVSWYTFGDVYLTSVRTAMEEAMTAQGMTFQMKDSNANQQTQTDDINTALVTGADAIVINMVESGAIGTAETLMNAVRAYDKPAVFFNRAVSTDDAEAAALFLGYEKSAFIGTKFDEACGEYLHFAGLVNHAQVTLGVLGLAQELAVAKDVSGGDEAAVVAGDGQNGAAFRGHGAHPVCASVPDVVGKIALELFQGADVHVCHVHIAFLDALTGQGDGKVLAAIGILGVDDGLSVFQENAGEVEIRQRAGGEKKKHKQQGNKTMHGHNLPNNDKATYIMDTNSRVVNEKDHFVTIVKRISMCSMLLVCGSGVRVI